LKNGRPGETLAIFFRILFKVIPLKGWPRYPGFVETTPDRGEAFLV
jgi:hypothetical protein